MISPDTVVCKLHSDKQVSDIFVWKLQLYIDPDSVAI